MPYSHKALTHLLRAYRSIYHRAFVRGLAAAAVLTAGLGIGAVQAADLTDQFDSVYTDNYGTDSSQRLVMVIKEHNAVFTGDVTIDADTASSLDGVDFSGSTYVIYAKPNPANALDVYGTFTVSGEDVDVRLGSYAENCGTGDFEINFNGLAVTAGGTLHVSAQSGHATSLDVTNGISVAAGTLDLANNAAAAGSDVMVSGDITVSEAGTLSIRTTAGNSVEVDGVTTVENSDFTVEGAGSAVLYGMLNLSNAEVVNTSSNALQVQTSGGTWTGTNSITGNLTLALQDPDFDEEDLSSVNSAQITVEDGTVALNGTLTISSGTLYFEEGTVLQANQDYAWTNSANTGALIIISGGSTEAGVKNAASNATLAVSSETLKGYLGEGEETLHSGAVFLWNAGELHFTDADTVTLNDFTFASGSQVGAGVISVYSASDKSGGIISAASLAVTEQLNYINGELTDDPLLFLEADELILGSEGFASSELSGTLGFSSAAVGSSLQLIAGTADDGSFYLQDDVVLKLNDGEASGEIVGSDLTFAGGTLTVADGTWIAKEGLDFSFINDNPVEGESGALVVGGSAATGDAALEMHGELTFDEAEEDIYIRVQGTESGSAVLDLAADDALLCGEDISKIVRIQVSGTADHQGLLRLNEQSFANIVNFNAYDEESEKTVGSGFALQINDYGVTEVAGDGALDFDNFGNYDGRISIRNTGLLRFDGDVSLSTDREDGILIIGLGSGSAVEAQNVSLNNTAVGADGAVSFEQGTLIVHQSLTSDNALVEIGTSDDTAGAVLRLEGEDGAAGSVEPNLMIGAKGSLEAEQGAWTLQEVDASGDIAVSNAQVSMTRLNLSNDAALLAAGEYGSRATMVVIADLGAAETEAEADSALDGKLLLGQNTFTAVGSTLDDAAMVLSPYLTADGSLNESGDGTYGAMLYAAQSIEFADGSYGVLSSTQSSDDLEAGTYSGNTFTWDERTLIIAEAETFWSEEGEAPGVISFAASGASVLGSGTVELRGSYDLHDYLNIFADAGGSDENGTSVTLDGTLTVRSANGLLSAVLDSEGDYDTSKVKLTVDENELPAFMQDVSSPVQDFLLDYAAADSGADYSCFINSVLTQGQGSDAETAARLAAYAGTVQSALAASASAYEAIAARTGAAVAKGALAYADNPSGAGIWLTPVYKNIDASGFNAQGTDYGTDLDLYGAALGADYTFAAGWRLGAMFSLGTGDADGKGAGRHVSNDFDFWAAGLYAGWTRGNFSLSADLTYTEADNDIDGHTSLGRLSGSTDSSAWSLGLSARYKLVLDAVDITPHLGLRYTRLDVDDFSVGLPCGGRVSYDFDALNIFSIPLGVSFSKDLAAGEWLIKPVLDLTVTANTGDDDLDEEVSFSGITQDLHLSSEVLDDFTYGAALGLAAQYGFFSLGLNVSYVGSDNVDEYGAAAYARFTF